MFFVIFINTVCIEIVDNLNWGKKKSNMNSYLNFEFY